MRARTTDSALRAVFALVLALAMALRLLSPAGFMPAFDHGAVVIVPCPDAQPAPMAHHHHPGDKGHQQPCPYAAGSSVGSLPLEAAPVPPSAFPPEVLAAASLPDIPLTSRDRDRPPTTGPPALPA